MTTTHSRMTNQAYALHFTYSQSKRVLKMLYCILVEIIINVSKRVAWKIKMCFSKSVLKYKT